MQNSLSSTSAILAAVIEHLRPAPRFAGPWQHLTPGIDGHGTIADKARALSDLIARFGVQRLLRIGVIRIRRNGPRLAPGLTKPCGAVIAMRAAPGRTPFALLAGRTIMPIRRCPLRAARRDSWSAEQMARGGILFGAADTADVLLLRALGMPATLVGSLRWAGITKMAYLSSAFTQPDLGRFDPFSDHDLGDGLDDDVKCDGGPSASAPVDLVFVGWSMGELSLQPPAPLISVARHLQAGMDHLKYQFDGVGIWIPEPKEIEKLRFRLRLREFEVAALQMRTSANNKQYYLNRLAAGPPKRLTFARAQAALLAALEAGPATGTNDEIDRARAAYEAFIERRLVGPLRKRCLNSNDFLTRQVGVQASSVFDLLHRLSPHLMDQQRRSLCQNRGADGPPIPSETFGQYMALMTKAISLTRDLTKLNMRFV